MSALESDQADHDFLGVQLSRVGPVTHRHLKLPKLEHLVNSFDARGRRVILHSSVGSTSDHPVAEGQSHIGSAGVAVVVGSDQVEGPLVSPQDLNGWIPNGSHSWEWMQSGSDLKLSTFTCSGPNGACAVLYLGLSAAESDIDRVRGLVAQGSGVGPDVDRRPDRTAFTTPVSVPVGDIPQARERLVGRPVLAVTGAGISAASGVMPFFGPSGIDSAFGLLEPFPGRLVEAVRETPDSVVELLVRWHLSFLAAEPTPAHFALVDLERRGHLAGVFTTNIDRLHHAAGARRVAETEQLSRAQPPPGAGLIVVGSANDPSGVVARARATGAMVVIIDRRVPDWAQAEDLVILGDPQQLVPDLVREVTGTRTPLTVTGDRTVDAWLPTLPDLDVPGQAVAEPWSELPALADLVRRRSPAARSVVHGPRHWLSVAWIGARLASTDPDVDPLTVALFALFHDCQRHHDGHDLEHGGRGADEAMDLLASVEWITAAQRDRLAEACRWHTHGRVTDDPTVGACWDADRLDLWRVGATPLARLLSHPNSPDLSPWSRRFLDVGDDDAAWDDWNPIALVYAALAASESTYRR